MMEELVKLVSKKTGISEELAEKAVKVVLDYLKDKLPDPIASQLDAVLEGGGLADMLGGLLGK
jgi:uncharacterized protein (DUF2267 family)